MGVHKKTIDFWKKKPAWHDLVIAALDEEKHTLNDYAKKLIAMKDKKKIKNIGGQRFEVDDNIAQVAYLKEVANVYGFYAPKEIDVRHGIQNMSDEEIRERLDNSVDRVAPEEQNSTACHTIPTGERQGESHEEDKTNTGQDGIG